MALLKPIENGRMYGGWHRWNIIGGCEHGCSYCYMKSMGKRFGKDFMTSVFHENMLRDDLGSGRKIFCCSSGDAWGTWVKSKWISEMLLHCRKYPENKYMFLTKHPVRYRAWAKSLLELDCIVGATIETDVDAVGYEVSDAMGVSSRLYWMEVAGQAMQTMISVEPVMKFSAKFFDRLRNAEPDVVYVGVDSGKNGLPEPSRDELAELIDSLSGVAEVRLKKGIERILGAELLADLQGGVTV